MNADLPSSIVHRPSIKEVIPLRIGILMDHPSPHMVAFLDAIAERKDCTATVLYCGQSAPERGWGAPVGGLPHRFLKGLTVSGGVRINLGLINALKKATVDAWVVNTVYSSPSTLLAASWLDWMKIPWVYMNEPPRPRNKIGSTFKSFPLQSVIRRANAIIGMGEKAASIYQELLGNNRPVTSIPYYLDLDKFLDLPLSAVPTNGESLNFVVCCQMIHRKGIDILLKACQQLSDMRWRLTLVGEGPLRTALDREFRNRFKHDRVIFRGEISYEKRVDAFVGQNVFLFPSRWDGWGMVVPEALAAGLPVVATDQVISAHEFVRNGVNGFIIPSEDPSTLAEKMEYFIRNPETIPEMSVAARKSLESYRPELGAEKLLRFLNDVLRYPEHFQKKRNLKASEVPLNWKTLTTPASVTDRISKGIRQFAKDTVIRIDNALRINRGPKGNRILVYHLVLREDRKLFEDHIKFLRDYFLITSVSEILRTVTEAKDKDEYRAAITFDDGFRILMSDCLEVLNKYEIKATFFVPTGFVDLSDRPDISAIYSLRAHYYNFPLEPMTPEDLQLLVKLGHEVESHGVSHISVNAMSRQQVLRELEESKRRIAEWTGITPKAFAYPYGHTSNVIGDPKDWLRQSGYSFGLTLRRGKLGDQTDPFIAARDHVEGNWPINYLKYFLLS